MIQNKFIILGIDPGFSGGLAFLDPLAMDVEAYPMPVIKGKKTTLDKHAILDLITQYSPSIVWIESVASRPGQGVSSMFNFGYWSGYFEGLFSGLAIPFNKIPPQIWMKDIFEGQTKDEKASIRFCQNLWPKKDWTKSERARVPHDGMTDSTCIALAGYRRWKKDHLN